jgi:hypothetical protein
LGGRGVFAFVPHWMRRQTGLRACLKNGFVGSTGDSPVPSGDSPDGTGAIARANGHSLFAALLAEVPVGGSPTAAGESPAPLIFKTRSNKDLFLASRGRAAKAPWPVHSPSASFRLRVAWRTKSRGFNSPDARRSRTHQGARCRW